QTIICSETPTGFTDKSCMGSCSGSDPKIYLVEASKSSCSSSSSSSSSCKESSKACKVIYTPNCKSSCNNSYGSAYYDFCAIVRPVRNFALLNGKSCEELKINVSINDRTI